MPLYVSVYQILVTAADVFGLMLPSLLLLPCRFAAAMFRAIAAAFAMAVAALNIVAGIAAAPPLIFLIFRHGCFFALRCADIAMLITPADLLIFFSDTMIRATLPRCCHDFVTPNIISSPDFAADHCWR